jgi:hypothetical protein
VIANANPHAIRYTLPDGQEAAVEGMGVEFILS